jgi:hypothetical protein
MDASALDSPAAAPPGQRCLTRRRWIVFVAVTLLVAPIVPLLAAEILFRVFPGLLPHELQVQLALAGTTQSLYAADPVLEHRAVPGFDADIPHGECPHHVCTVSLPRLPAEWGFRTPPLDADRPIDTVVVGDSMAFGYGVAEDQTLAGLLREDSAGDGQVVNLGLSNKTGSVQYELILRRFLEVYRPRQVVIMHFENDYTDNAFFVDWQGRFADDPSLAYPRSRELNGRGRFQSLRRLKRQSLTATLLVNAARKLTSDRQPIAGAKVEYAISPEVLEIVDPENDAAARGCELGFAALQRMISSCRDASAAVTVVMIPSKEQALAPEDEVERYTRFYRRTAAFCREEGVCVVELLEPFRHYVRSQHLYFAVDGHCTAAGHALAHRQLRSTVAAKSGQSHRH